MIERISSDTPVKEEKEDKFQRYNFSKRIADTISSSATRDSVVVGIYGKWGEGKTSVINFILSELKGQNDIVSVKFNPWRFPNEQALLSSFFNHLAAKIKNADDKFKIAKKRKWIPKIPKKGKVLKSNSEALGDLLSQYGKGISFYGVSDVANTIGEISNVDSEEYKRRFEKLLLESDKKLVIFIDDIDRLDKDELHSIFKLVKLTANFDNTYYILAFDDKMVASAIGERYGSGDIKAGYNFLEKIIQVPLRLPVAQPFALKRYCFNLLEAVLKNSQIDLNDKETSRFIGVFSSCFLIRLSNPRLAIRYANSLSFAFPLLKGEVNHVDLMFIEGLKIFYPSHYEFVKNNSEYFTQSYKIDRDFDFTNAKDRKEQIPKHLERLAEGLTEKEKEAIKKGLMDFFPYLKGVFRNTHLHKAREIWYKEKKIAVPDYFNRYFTYSVIEGELSDVLFKNFINSLSHNNEDDIKAEIEFLIEKSSVDSFLFKLRTFEEDLNWDKAMSISKVIVKNGAMFPKRHTLGFASENPNSQACIFIYHLLANNENRDEVFNISKEFFELIEPLEMSFELYRWLSIEKPGEGSLYGNQQLNQLSEIILRRHLKNLNQEPFFIVYPDNTYNLVTFWNKINNTELNNEVRLILEKNPKSVKEFIYSLTSSIWSSSEPKPYKVDFDEKQYEFFDEIFDVQFLYKLVQREYLNDLKKKEVVFVDKANRQTAINALRQFSHWHIKKHNQKD